MEVSGEFKYLGPDFSSTASVRPVNAITFPASLAIGNITRLRNLEYMAASRTSDLGPPTLASPVSAFRLSAPGFCSPDPGVSSELSSRAEADNPFEGCPPESRDLWFC